MVRFETPYNKRAVPPHRDGTASHPDAADKGARKWNSWWSRRSPNIETNDHPPVCIGIDAGSKTLKFVTLDEDGEIVHGLYHRHHADVRTSFAELLHDVIWRYGDMELPIAVTGSAGIALASALGLPFVQEVIATTNAVKARYPQADCIIELGGEDAKITYLDGLPEQRMNASCAGGTGDFIDSIASMLGCKTREISKLALGSTRTYPIASRCAVFAQTDVRPLINAGIPKADIAQSALEAVANQTLGGLACGRPIRGNIVFLGGPLEHIPALLMTFKRKLGLARSQCIKPPDAHLFTAMGAILTAENPPVIALSELERRLHALPPDDTETGTFEPLADRTSDVTGQSIPYSPDSAQIIEKRLENAEGPLYLGFDAGSTTMKYALIDSDGSLVTSDYQNVEGDTFKTAQEMIGAIVEAVDSGNRHERRRYIARAVVTGYGEDLLKAGFHFDAGVVETVAHLKAAQYFYPDVSFVLDIGGQDMKAIWLRDGMVVDAVLNEACSSGCGAFVASCTKSLMLSPEEFSRAALEASHPIDLGAKCTVFMTSRVRHAQKTGTPTGDIAAGVAYSIANNVMSRLIGTKHSESLGSTIVVQGGTFKSDAVLRAFEKVAGVTAIRPNIAHLMGAFGAALVAREQGIVGDTAEARVQGIVGDTVVDAVGGMGDSADVTRSSLLDSDTIARLKIDRTSARCTGCGNACLVSVIDFGNGEHFISGNRCDRAYPALFGDPAPGGPVPGDPVPGGSAQSGGHVGHVGHAPNVVELEQKLISSFGSKTAEGPIAEGPAAEGPIAERPVIGIMNTMNTYESIPFWHTLFTGLGFSVLLPDDGRSASVEDRARETIPSESVCYPAKLSHIRYADLVCAGADIVFMPLYRRGPRCPVASQYADAVRLNVDRPKIASPTLEGIRPCAIAANQADCDALFDFAIQLDPDITRTAFNAAVAQALDRQSSFEESIRLATAHAFEWVAADRSRRAAVLAVRPYHIDPALLHDIDRELARLGFAVIPQLGMQTGTGPVETLWKPAKNLIRLIESTARNRQVEIIALRSFGCGYDAVSFDEARDLAMELHRPFTELKIDEIIDTAHIRIRLRTLEYTTHQRDSSHGEMRGLQELGEPPELQGTCITPDLCYTAKALAEIAAGKAEKAAGDDGNAGNDDANDGAGALSVRIPRTCLDCLTNALPFELHHLGFPSVSIDEQMAKGVASPGKTGKPGRKVGLLGNPLLVFNSELNEHIEDLLEDLGCRVVYPDPQLVTVDDVRYLDQLERFRSQGVERVIYLQSFGCLKGHVQSRGAIRDLMRRYPDLPITIIDYDPESSALNRENRIRLAVGRTPEEVDGSEAGDGSPAAG